VRHTSLTVSPSAAPHAGRNERLTVAQPQYSQEKHSDLHLLSGLVKCYTKQGNFTSLQGRASDMACTPVFQKWLKLATHWTVNSSVYILVLPPTLFLAEHKATLTCGYDASEITTYGWIEICILLLSSRCDDVRVIVRMWLCIFYCHDVMMYILLSQCDDVYFILYCHNVGGTVA